MQVQIETPGKGSGRRSVLLLAAAAALVIGTNRWLNRPAPLVFEEVPGVPGFRMLRFASVSGARFDPFVGLNGPGPASRTIPDGQLCGTLFSAAGPGVPVASFSDYYCPYCRVLTRELASREHGGEISVTWHELPLLGDTSDLAARAALAADMQGAYPDIHARLMRSRIVATDQYLWTLAEGAGLDPDRFVRDAGSLVVRGRIETARALAARFGFYGTPALVIGRTAVLGAVPPETLDRLIAQERDNGQTRSAVCP